MKTKMISASLPIIVVVYVYFSFLFQERDITFDITLDVKDEIESYPNSNKLNKII